MPILAAIGFVTLRTGTPAAASAMGRYLRFSAYALALGLITTLDYESTHLAWGGGGLATAIRALIEIGLLVGVFLTVQQSQPIRQANGRTFPARVADALVSHGDS